MILSISGYLTEIMKFSNFVKSLAGNWMLRSKESFSFEKKLPLCNYQIQQKYKYYEH